MKKAANIYASLYDGHFDVGFDCPGAESCQYALCAMMPPDGVHDCFFHEHGSCRQQTAQYDALERLMKRLKGKMKEFDDE